MFCLLNNSTENLGLQFRDGEVPTKQQLVDMLHAGLTIAGISEHTGIAVDVLEQISGSSGETEGC